jgi:hypothetical protein
VSRVLLRRDANVLRRSYLKGAVGTPAQAMFDDTAQGGGSSLLIRGQYDPSLELNYVDDPRLACGEVFTRATIRTVRDFEGRTLTLNSGEVGFWGMRRVENLLDFTEDATNAYWTKDDITIEANVSSQPGGVSSAPRADKLVETAANSDHRLQPTGLGSVVGRVYVSSFRVKAAERTLLRRAGERPRELDGHLRPPHRDRDLDAIGRGRGGRRVRGRRLRARVDPLGVDQRRAVPGAGPRRGGRHDLRGLAGLGPLLPAVPAPGRERASYLGPSEYVSKRMLVAPYHGANVDGVRYFVTDYYGVVIPRYTGDTIKYHHTLRGTWTQLGAIQVLTAGAIFAGTATLRAGRLVGGLLFRAQIFSVGADNAPVLISDFNPNLAAAAGSASFVASTGETWTVQNNGTIGRINTFTKNARMGLFRERAGTNLQIRSDALDDATYTKTRATATANTISGVDGSLIGDKLVEDASAAATHIVQDTALVKAALSSATDIANSALTRLGAAHILDIADTATEAGRVLNVEYPMARDKLLRTYRWVSA